MYTSDDHLGFRSMEKTQVFCRIMFWRILEGGEAYKPRWTLVTHSTLLVYGQMEDRLDFRDQSPRAWRTGQMAASERPDGRARTVLNGAAGRGILS